MASERLPRKLAAILYADVAGYSRLMGEDEEATHQLLSTHLDLISGSIDSHHGRVVHYAGDAVLADFGTVTDALECAATVQQELAERNGAIPGEQQVHFRIGVNLGEVIVDRDDIYGDGVNVAARLESLAEPGGICISESVRTAIGKKLPLEYEFMGERQVKNIAEPVRAYRVSIGGVSSAPSEKGPEALSLPSKPSIVVLALDNMSGDPEQEYFSDGIAEDLITDLSKISGLFVIARNSAFTYKGTPVNAQNVCRELGVRFVLEGSVRKAGDRVRITAQLIDGTTGGHVWAERYDREMTDIFAVQDEVTQEIVAALAPKLTVDEQQRLANRMTDNLEAYDYFLRGRDQALRDTAEANAQARTLLQKAVEFDPQFSAAFSHLGRNHVLAYVNRWGEDPDGSLELAMKLGQRAVELDEFNPDAHFTVGAAALWMKQHGQAIAEAEKAIAIDANFAEGHAILGLILIYVGKPREAVTLLETAMRLDPHYRDILLHILALAHFHLGQYDEAITLLKRRLIRKPESDISRVLLAAIYGHRGEVEKSRSEWAEALRNNPNYSLEHRRRILPYKNPADFEHWRDGLRKAGLVESQPM